MPEDKKPTLKGLMDRVDNIEESVADEQKARLDNQEAQGDINTGLRTEVKENATRLAKMHTVNTRQDGDLHDLKNKVDGIKKSRFSSNFKEKCIIGGIYLSTAALFVVGVVKIGKLPKAEPINLIVGDMSNKLAQEFIEDLGKQGVANVTKIATKAADAAAGKVLN